MTDAPKPAGPDHTGPRKSPGHGPSGRAHPKARRQASAEDVPSHFAGVTPRQPYAGRGSFDRKRPEKPSVNPRRVRGGVRMKNRSDETPAHWVCERLHRFLESSVPGAAMIEGRGYAEVGQARSLAIEAGSVTASVQGRSEKPWNVEIGLRTFSDAQVAALVDGFAAQALFSAKLLAKELPHSIEEFVQELGLRLVPASPDELTVSCSCGGPHAIPAHLREPEDEAEDDLSPEAEALAESQAVASLPATKPTDPSPNPSIGPSNVSSELEQVNPDGTWCKHVACVMLLLSDRIAENPLLVFRMRGLHEDDLLSRMREQRALSGRGSESIPVYRSHVEGIESVPARALDEVVADSPESFWEMPQDAETLELPVSAPDVRHPLLRRLGASPFPGAVFPLVGLLATCYDVMGDYVRGLDDESDEGDADAADSHNADDASDSSRDTRGNQAVSPLDVGSDAPPPLPKPKRLTAKPMGKPPAKAAASEQPAASKPVAKKAKATKATTSTKAAKPLGQARAKPKGSSAGSGGG